jgi:hypothetical protein
MILEEKVACRFHEKSTQVNKNYLWQGSLPCLSLILIQILPKTVFPSVFL